MDHYSLKLKEAFFRKAVYKFPKTTKFSRPEVIGFIGSIGSGKTTISNILSKQLNLPVLDNDGIRRFLNNQGIPGESPLPDLVIDIARERMKRLLSRQISYILDADLTLTFPEDNRNISSMGARLLLVKIDCPENLTLQRISDREINTTKSLADKKSYFERQQLRKQVKINPKYIFFTIDNSKKLDNQVKRLISKIKALHISSINHSSDRNRKVKEYH